MAYITNDGARLIERARTEGRLIVFGSVRMNTVYKSDPTSLVQKTEEWYGENHGSVVGCISHVSVNGVSEVCDSKLAVQCYDNGESWKSIGIYARLNSEEEDEVLFACESIENGEYKDVTIVELPVTLAGVVEDFGLSEGGSGGGGEVPANMMTTNTEQWGLSGFKQWCWDVYEGTGTVDAPQEGDTWRTKFLTIGEKDPILPTELPVHLKLSSINQDFVKGDWQQTESESVTLDSHCVKLGEGFKDPVASWSSIINAARIEQGFDQVTVYQRGDGSIEIGDVRISPNSEIKIGAYVVLVIDGNSKIASVRANGSVLDISVAVFEFNGSMHRVSGIISGTDGLSFDQPITPAEGQNIYIHWSRYNNI